MVHEPPEDLLSEGLADIDQDIPVSSIVVAVIYQEGGVAPVVGVPVRRQGEGRGADGARRLRRLDEASRVGERAGAAGAQKDE